MRTHPKRIESQMKAATNKSVEIQPSAGYGFQNDASSIPPQNGT